MVSLDLMSSLPVRVLSTSALAAEECLESTFSMKYKTVTLVEKVTSSPAKLVSLVNICNFFNH